MPELGVAAFLGKGDFEPFLPLSRYRCLFHQVSLLQNEQKRRQRKNKTSRRTKEGVFFFFLFLFQGLCNQQEGL